MNTRKHKWLLGAGLLGLSVAGASLSVQQARRPSVPSEARPSSPSATARADWNSDAEHVYAIALDTQLGLSIDQPVLHAKLSGSWSLRALREDGQETLYASAIDAKTIEVIGDEHAASQVDELRAALARPFFFSLDESGLIVSTQVAPSTSSLAEGLVRALVSYTQFDRRAVTTTPLLGTELDASGRHSVRYEAAADGRRVKHKLEYLEVLGVVGKMPAGAATLEIVQSDQTFEHAGGDLMALRVDEHLVMRSTELPAFHTWTKLEMTFEAVRASPLPAAELLARVEGAPRRPVFQRSAAEQDLERMRRQRGVDTSLPSVMSELDALSRGVESDENQRKRIDLFARARDAMAAKPEAVEQALERLRKSESNAHVWIAALGSAGTREAQAALRTLYHEEHFTPNLQREILQGLSFVQEAAPETVETLWSLVDHPLMGVQAKLGLGTAANRLRASAPERADAIVAQLEERLATETEAAQRINYLRALGNAGSPDSLAVLAQELANPSAAARAQAMRSLRLMPEGRADEILAARMLVEQESSVRATAVRAARNRQPSAAIGEALFVLMQNEKDPNARQEVYKTLSAWGAAAPYVQQAFSWAREHETDGELLAMIGDAS